MSKLTFAILVALPLVAAGCGRSGATAKATAKRLFDAYRRGDTPGILEHIQLPDWERDYWDKSRKAFARNGGFRFKVLSAAVEGNRATVTVKVKEEKDAEWATRDIRLRKIEGSWKTALEEFTDVTGATILTLGESDAKGAAVRMLAAGKTGDADVLLDHLDLKGMYEANVPEDQREQMKYEDFEKMTRDAMKRGAKPNPEFDYQIISSETKGDEATVKVKTKENKDAEWKEMTVPFKKIDGKWKLSWEGIMAMGEVQ